MGIVVWVGLWGYFIATLTSSSLFTFGIAYASIALRSLNHNLDFVELVHVRLKLLCETKVSVVANDAFIPRRHLITTLTITSLLSFYPIPKANKKNAAMRQ